MSQQDIRLQKRDKNKTKIISNFEMLHNVEKRGELKAVSCKQYFPTLNKTINGFMPGELIVITGQTGSGKCHGSGTKIMMYSGDIKNVEDIKVGDELMGDDSRPRKVMSLAQGEDNLYEVIQSKADNYTVNESHILCLQRTRMSKADDLAGNIIEISVRDYLKTTKYMKHMLKGYKVGVDWRKKKTKIDSYLLGLWLGDGSSNRAEITTADKEIADYLIKNFHHKNGFRVSITEQKNNKSKIYRICETTQKERLGSTPKNRVKEILRYYNLLGNKHIPKNYKNNSRKERLSVLAGLLDSDGHKTSGCGLDFIFKSEKLANDVVFLCRSLGLRASIRKAEKTIKSIGFKGIYFRIGVFGNLQEIPCLIEGKKAKPKQKVSPLRTGITIKPKGFGKYYGFTINGNGRYLLGDFTVTHNTLLAQTFTREFCDQMERSLWFTYEVPPRYFLNQFHNKSIDLQFYMPEELKPFSIDWLEEMIKKGVEKVGANIIFIDHVHYIYYMSSGNASHDIGRIVQRIKRLAVDLELVIFLIAHTTKTKIEHEDDMGVHKIKDSSHIAQEADTALFVHRKVENNGVTETFSSEVKVCKSRREGVMHRVIPTIKVGKYLRELDSE